MVATRSQTKDGSVVTVVNLGGCLSRRVLRQGSLSLAGGVSRG
jgi:hypothetical protein